MNHYPLVSRILHWLLAVLMIFLFGLGFYMMDLGYYDSNYTLAYRVHKEVGMIALVLGFCQLLRLVIHRSPDLLPTLRTWERISARTVHSLLFALIVLIPLSGYAIAVGAGQGVDFFGILTIPALLPEALTTSEMDIEDLASRAHFYLAWVGVALVTLHVAGAIKHHFIDRDDTLRRILFRSQTSGAERKPLR